MYHAVQRHGFSGEIYIVALSMKVYQSCSHVKEKV